MIEEFLHALGIESLLKNSFKTNDSASFRIHKDDENLLQMIYQIFGTYYEDNCADELRHDSVLSAVLGKEALASQPTLSRFFNRMDDDTLCQFNSIMLQLRRKIYSLKMPGFVLFDIDTTLLPIYGKQEGEGFNPRSILTFVNNDEEQHILCAFLTVYCVTKSVIVSLN